MRPADPVAVHQRSVAVLARAFNASQGASTPNGARLAPALKTRPRRRHGGGERGNG
jgi:hypothetical protein